MKVYVVSKDYENRGGYDEYVRVSNSYVGVFQTMEEAYRHIERICLRNGYSGDEDDRISIKYQLPLSEVTFDESGICPVIRTYLDEEYDEACCWDTTYKIMEVEI